MSDMNFHKKIIAPITKPTHVGNCHIFRPENQDDKKARYTQTDVSRGWCSTLKYVHVHHQLQLLKAEIARKDQEILELKNTVVDLRSELDQPEQHGSRVSLRFTGLPENEAHDDTDKLILDVCSAIKIDPPVQPTDIAVSHQLGQKAPGKTDK